MKRKNHCSLEVKVYPSLEASSPRCVLLSLLSRHTAQPIAYLSTHPPTPPLPSSFFLLTPLRFSLSPRLDSFQYTLPILIQLQFRHNHFTRMDTQGHALSIALLAGKAFDMDDVFEAVDGHNFSFAAFVRAAGYEDFVVFAYGDGADLLGEAKISRLDWEWIFVDVGGRHTLCFSRSSLFKGALMMTRRTLEGAL